MSALGPQQRGPSFLRPQYTLRDDDDDDDDDIDDDDEGGGGRGGTLGRINQSVITAAQSGIGAAGE